MNNPQAVKFCNEGVRVTADHLAEAYYAARALVAVYDATGMSELLGDDPTFTTLVEDGSDVDGRPRLSVGGVKLTIENLRALIQQLESTQTPTGLSLIQGVLSISPRYHR